MGGHRRRRQRVEELIAACGAEVAQLEALTAVEKREAFCAVERLEARHGTLLGPTAVPEQPSGPGSGAAPLRPQAGAAAPPGPASAAGESPAVAQLPPPSLVALLEILAHDNTVMECNLRDYDHALTAVLKEIRNLKAEQASMKNSFSQVDRLHELLTRELEVHDQLAEENEALLISSEHLRGSLAAAAGSLAADYEDGAVSLIENLIHENGKLRKLLFDSGLAQDDGPGELP